MSKKMTKIMSEDDFQKLVKEAIPKFERQVWFTRDDVKKIVELAIEQNKVNHD